MAFTSSFTPRFSTTSAYSLSLTCTSSSRPNRAASAQMKADIAEKVLASRATFTYTETDRLSKETAAFTPTRGFVRNAELLNGRLAQLGFAIGLATELLTGKGIVQQLAVPFSPLAHFTEVFSSPPYIMF